MFFTDERSAAPFCRKLRVFRLCVGPTCFNFASTWEVVRFTLNLNLKHMPSYIYIYKWLAGKLSAGIAMGLWVLDDKHLEHVPGTAPLADIGRLGQDGMLVR